VLADARRIGLVGPGPVEPHVEHALGFAAALEGQPPDGPAVDLGTGGGLPGLVLAWHWPGSRWALVDARARSVEAARVAVGRLGLEERVVVVAGRAEELGRSAAWRGRAALVVARGFGPPAVTAECAAPLLRPGGRLVVSEPPGSTGSRWDVAGLGRLGLGRPVVVEVAPGTYAVVVQEQACPEAYPRRVGAPGKRPLW
jgi:16S rRNA (guanine527-N7)-methyltransferase